jgi:hypothetical protein
MDAYLVFVLNHRIAWYAFATNELVPFVSTQFCPDALSCSDAISDPHEFYSWVKEIRKLYAPFA